MPPHSRAAELIQLARTQSGLSLREIARRAGTSHATLSAYLKGVKVPSTDTLLRIIEACDMAVDFIVRPRIRRSESGLPRGEELAQVLRLAAQFPSRQPRTLRAPRFAEQAHGHR